MTISAYPKYESYRDSAEGWLGKVPTHWNTRKLKQLFQEKKHRANMNLNCGAISFGEVVEKDDDRIPLATKASYQEVSAGEFLVNPLNLNYDLKSLRIGLSNINVVVSAGYIVLQAKDEMDKRYFNYLLHRYDVAFMKLLGSGVRQTISFNHIANSILIAPPLPEQRAIAAFLDTKCGKIDEAVRIKEEQIALLKERRQILIQQAVTRGINPDAPMKDSGIDWIGEIPAHWEVKRLRYLAELLDGDRGPNYPSPSDLVDDGFIFLSSKNIVNGKLDFSVQNFISEAKFRSLGRGKLKSNDIIITMRGTTGHTAVFNCDFETGFINAQMLIIRCFSNTTPAFLHQFTTTNAWKNQISVLAYGSAQQQLSSQILKDLWVAAPPKKEQHAINEHLEQLHQQFDNAISLKESQIAALKEYKTSLINAAVTGKIKVS